MSGKEVWSALAADAERRRYEENPQVRQEPDGSWTFAGTPYCPPGGHDWRPLPGDGHESVTGRRFECANCKHGQVVGP